MNLILLLSISFLYFFSVNCVQTAYKFVHEHCEIPYFNESLVDLPLKTCYKPTRTGLALNLTLKFHVDIPSDDVAYVEIVGYQFRSNEYRKGPIEAMLGMCSFIQTEKFDMPHMLSNSNFTACPLKKSNTYYIRNLVPDAENFPPGIPDGRWMLELKFMYREIYYMFGVRWFAKVEYEMVF
ncbi:hypothetical protein ILUMI_01393 [Ignelater luminosus]|uniref:MD-2-related lipid-recognition domain-containing protein n=1 Tax=Ignelater luminosus TaxID=2038154 RepID=A0A8K0GKB2_IGNLU|nr:hypothetical protein ILUMI_01393 [Ignelater luminosus]